MGLETVRRANQTESEAVAEATRARQEAEARAEAAILERDALAVELETAFQTSREANAEAGARVEALDAEHTRLMQEWQDDVVRLEVAVRERDLVAAERDAIAAEPKPSARRAARRRRKDRVREQEFHDAAEQRIRELELQLQEPEFEVPEGDAAAALAAVQPQIAPAAVEHQPPRRASRHAFNQDVQIQIDGSATQLVDLSTTGAQVISPTALKPNRMVKVSFPIDDNMVSFRGKIMWARLEPPSAGGPFCYRAGVFFTSVDEAAVQAFIKHHNAPSQ